MLKLLFRYQTMNGMFRRTFACVFAAAPRFPNFSRYYGESRVKSQSAQRESIMNVVERIRQSHDSLTTTEQEAADFILGHLTDALISNSAELSQLSGVSQPTLSRLFRKLGYKNAREFRRDVRRYHQPGAPEVASPDSTSGNFAHDLLERDTTSLSRTYNRISDGQIATLAARILDARTVAILGLRNNYPMALHLREQLIQSRSNVMMLPQPGQSLSEEIVDLGGRDLAILFGVRRRTPIFATIAAELHRQGRADNHGGRLHAAPHRTVMRCDIPGSRRQRPYPYQLHRSIQPRRTARRCGCDARAAGGAWRSWKGCGTWGD
jgi:DNA-binding MurR/RpiR family transcriptional regulator